MLAASWMHAVLLLLRQILQQAAEQLPQQPAARPITCCRAMLLDPHLQQVVCGDPRSIGLQHQQQQQQDLSSCSPWSNMNGKRELHNTDRKRHYLCS